MKDTQSPHPYCGKCLFCLSACPDCKSTQVEVRFTTAYYYRNGEPDRIQVWRREHHVIMACRECGKSFLADHPSMRRLAGAAAETIGLAPCYEIAITGSENIRKHSFFLKPTSRVDRAEGWEHCSYVPDSVTSRATATPSRRRGTAILRSGEDSAPESSGS